MPRYVSLTGSRKNSATVEFLRMLVTLVTQSARTAATARRYIWNNVLASVFAGQTTVVAALSAFRTFASTIAGRTTVSAVLGAFRTFGSTFAGRSVVTALLGIRRAIAAVFAGSSVVLAAMIARRQLAAAIAAASVVVVAMVRRLLISSSFPGTSTVTGEPRAYLALTDANGVAFTDSSGAVLQAYE